MIIVGGGSSTRFGADKLLADVNGLPLIAHTIDSVAEHVDRCVVVCHAGIVDDVGGLSQKVTVTTGGATRTLSEMAGLAVLGGEPDLVGIHDAARPVVKGFVIDRLFKLAEKYGGAVPTLVPDQLVLDRKTHTPVQGVRRAQTPQVFRGSELMAAYVRAAEAGYDAQDTVEIVQRFSGTTVVTLPGDPANVKVTYPADLDSVRETITARSRT